MASTLGAIAEILDAIAHPGNPRKIPGKHDLQGDFTGWFDGGAIRVVTGETFYHFADGAIASIPTTPSLLIGIELADGKRFTLRQEK